MRAILFAGGESDGMNPLAQRIPTPLFPVCGRPILFHAIERIARAGVKQIDLFLSHLPERIEAEVGDGTRWGVKLTTHLIPGPEREWSRARILARFWGDETVLVARADFMPISPVSDLNAEPRFWSWNPTAAPAGATRSEWTGWAVLPAAWLAELPAEVPPERVAEILRGLAGASAHDEVGPVIEAREWTGYLDSNLKILRDESEPLAMPMRKSEPGVWIGRNVVIHPTARIVPPILICENTRIGAGCRVGPEAVIGAGCILADHSQVESSVVLPGTYLGEMLELTHCVAAHNRLVNVRLGADTTVTDNTILGRVAAPTLASLVTDLLERLLALVLIVAALPVVLVTAILLKLLRPGPLLGEVRCVRLPAADDPRAWRKFTRRSFACRTAAGGAVRFERLCRWLRLDDLPALPSIVAGDLHFVGLPPRTPAEVGALAPEWRTIYLASRAGIATLAAVEPGGGDPDALYCAETFWTAASGPWFNVRIFLRWLLGPRRSSAAYADPAPDPLEEAPGGIG